MSTKNIVYDYVIVGSGLTGLSIAAKLSEFTDNILLIDSNENVGSNHHVVKNRFGTTNNGLRYIAQTKKSEEALEFLNSLLPEAIVFENQEVPPIYYDSGNFKTFLGFGNNPPAFYNEIEYFTSTNRHTPSVPVYMWAEKLFSAFKGQYLPRSYVTKFVTQEENNHTVHHCIVNGTKYITGKNFIYTGTLKNILPLLPADVLGSRVRAKISKNAYWDAICLDLVHNHEVSQTSAIHVLNGTTQDEIGPCAGIFSPVDEAGNQVSQWMTFIDSQDAEETENIGGALKKIKRQIKRAYPNALENILSERIAVFPLYSGNGDLKLEENMTLPGLSNLWIGSSSVNEEKNIPGALLQAKSLCSALNLTAVYAQQPEA